VRLIRPLYVARLLTILLGLGVSLPAAAAEVASQAKRPAAKTTAKKKAPAKKPTYSAKASNARKARLARARAAARAREQARLRALKEAMTPRFKTDASGALVPDVRAAAAIIFNPETGQVLWEENAQDKRSIASITKVMTALVFLEDEPDLSRQITIERGDVYAASTTYLRANERITLDNVLHLTLIASDNAAARALARVSHGGTASFVERMNEKAIELGLESTTFADPSGLNPANISSAYDLSRLISFASGNEQISSIMRTAQYTVKTSRRSVNIHNTNRLLLDASSNVEVMGGKTGFITKAGYCLATLLRLPQYGNQQVAVVVLGARSNPGRFYETRHLFNWLSEKASDLLGKDQEQ
jgi:serine-type D-Ala-D-Ala endopeptidase (penicillin-binding protein 7)